MRHDQVKYDSPQVATWLAKMADEINAQRLTEPILIGIHSGGVWLAERLQPALHLAAPPAASSNASPAASPNASLGTLDISFYRDDFSRVGLNPEVKASHLPVAVDGRAIILVDDVLHTGRTIRAALNEIFSYGRPERVCLAVLIERPGRELPIQADVVGQSLDLGDHEEAKLSNTDGQLEMKVVTISSPAIHRREMAAGKIDAGEPQSGVRR